MIVAEAGSPEMLHLRPRIGQRLPNSPAMSALAAAYADDEEVEAWLDRLGPGAGAAARKSYRKAAAAVRARGYEIGLETVTRQRIGEVLAGLNSDPNNRSLRRSLAELVDQLATEDHKLLDPDSTATHPSTTSRRRSSTATAAASPGSHCSASPGRWRPATSSTTAGRCSRLSTTSRGRPGGGLRRTPEAL